MAGELNHNVDVIAEEMARRLGRSIRKSTVFIGDINRDVVDLNRKAGRGTAFRERVRRALFSNGTKLLLDVHSFPIDSPGKYAGSEMSILAFNGEPTPYERSLTEYLSERGVRVKLAGPGKADIVAEMRDHALASTLLEFNEGLTDQRKRQLASIVAEWVNKTIPRMDTHAIPTENPLPPGLMQQNPATFHPDGRSILVTGLSPSNISIVQRFQQVSPAARYDALHRGWAVPLEAVAALHEQFPRLAFGPGVMAAAERQMDIGDRTVRLVAATDYPHRLKAVVASFDTLTPRIRAVLTNYRAPDTGLIVIDRYNEFLTGLRTAQAESIISEGAQSIIDSFNRIINERETFLRPGLPLFPYQIIGQNFMVERKKGVLADHMGLGKTVQFIAAVKKLQNQGHARRVLVICPNSLKYNWKNEIEKWTTDTAVVVNAATRDSDLRRARDSFWSIINYDLMRREDVRASLVALHPDVIALDEASAIKNRETSQAQGVKVMANLANAPFRWALTGTPMENHPGDLFSVMEFVDHTILGDYDTFAERMFQRARVEVEGRMVTRVVGIQNLRQLREMMRGVMLRRTKEMVLRELPPKLRTDVWCEMTPDQQAQYDLIIGDLTMAVQSPDPRVRARIMPLFLFARMTLDHPEIVSPGPPAFFSGYSLPVGHSSCKLNELRNQVDTLLQNREKVVIFSQWRRMTDLIKRDLAQAYPDVPIFYINGSVSPEERVRMAAEFNATPGSAIFIGNKVMVYGLNLQSAQYIITVDQWFNPAVMEQVEDRLHRIGQRGNVTVVRIFVRNSLDERVLAILTRKEELFRRVIERGEGEEFEFDVSISLIEEILGVRSPEGVSPEAPAEPVEEPSQ